MSPPKKLKKMIENTFRSGKYTTMARCRDVYTVLNRDRTESELDILRAITDETMELISTQVRMSPVGCLELTENLKEGINHLAVEVNSFADNIGQAIRGESLEVHEIVSLFLENIANATTELIDQANSGVHQTNDSLAVAIKNTWDVISSDSRNMYKYMDESGVASGNLFKSFYRRSSNITKWLQGEVAKYSRKLG